MTPSASDYLWLPGRGCDADALGRMRAAFGCPRRPMGEAWFIGASREMYPCLAGNLDALPINRLQAALEAIASGPGSFGQWDEWTEWFHYLLPRLVPRCHERHIRALLEILVTALIAQHPDGLDDEPYAGFRRDTLDTLGRCMMDATCWPDGAMDVHLCLDTASTRASASRSGSTPAASSRRRCAFA